LDDDADRDAEFAARTSSNKAGLCARFADRGRHAIATFDGWTPYRLAGPSADPERYDTLVEDLISIATHLADHTGPIVWIAKMLNEGSLDEAWMRAHKRGGAWK